MQRTRVNSPSEINLQGREPLIANVIRLKPEPMTLDPNDAVHPDNCESVEQQDSRIIWRWASEPDGRYEDWMTHERRLRITIAGMVGRLLRQSGIIRFHKYVTGDVDHIVAEQLSDTAFQFAGTTTWGDGETNRLWIAPFVLTLQFEKRGQDCPKDARLCFGVSDGGADAIREPYGLRDERPTTARIVFENRPTIDSDWAVIVQHGG